VKRWDEFTFRPGALAFLAAVQAAGWPIVIVTNQSAIGRGLTTASEVAAIHDQLLAVADGAIEAILCCPHTPSDGCDCRKPRPGLLLQAARRLSLSLSSSYFLGDSPSDMAAADAAGCQGVLLHDLASGGSRPLDLQPGAFPVMQSFEAFLDLVGRRLEGVRA
jgi:D-glycero-D-manno-heptose 1,7-bisphosphate phosphatase